MQLLGAILRETLVQVVQPLQLAGVNGLLQDFLDQVVDEFIGGRWNVEVLEGLAPRQHSLRSQPKPTTPAVIAATVRIQEADSIVAILCKYKIESASLMLNGLKQSRATPFGSYCQQGRHSGHISRMDHEIHV
jgi:hypothetical protein